MQTCAVFDLDGVLVDSRKAVRLAYTRAGVEMPEDAWGKPWRAWLPQLVGNDMELAEKFHEKKCRVYGKMLQKHGQVLPLAHHLRNLVELRYPVFIITGASLEGATAACRAAKIDPSLIYDYSLTTIQKTHILSEICSSHYQAGVYYDDQDGVVVPATWARVKVVY